MHKNVNATGISKSKNVGKIKKNVLFFREGRRLERSFSGRPSFEDTATSPRREFSRSMSSDNWREAKKGGGEGDEDGGDGDWRRAGPRDKCESHFSPALFLSCASFVPAVCVIYQSCVS